ncbi:hypothetical protein HNQ91_001699 [Filimonas zeae]|uniref:DUF4375 domain-containing protein n=1 Tax=Filimonas zeae TaxID=1737353 RepID=A0A917IXS0_9BACT|nr:hypothetical protein [Filimonas zeae]MDR6338648.1 hypothetical protein [Filimonas zeae]GGH67228.1 hypothetical protein GCM10011379_22280 [Filimonas zeae]
MKVLMLTLLLMAGSFYRAEEPTLSTVRTLLKKAADDKASCKQLISLLQPYTAQNNPLMYGYYGVATMAQAKHAFNPVTKLSHFKKGKGMLNDAIAQDGNNTELRMLRYAAQKQAPSFLNYKEHLREDEAFLTAALPNITDSYLKTEVSGFLQNTKSQ